MVKEFLLRIAITLIVSVLIGVGLAPLIGFWSGTGVGLAIQIFGNYIYKDFALAKTLAETERALTDRVQALTTNMVRFGCPCGNNQFNEVILLNDDNTFTCDSCGQTIRLNVTFTPTVITTPLDNENQLKQLANIVPEEENE